MPPDAASTMAESSTGAATAAPAAVPVSPPKAPAAPAQQGRVKSHMDVEGSHELITQHPEHWRGYVASVMTLTLAVFGGSMLPVPWAFSVSGLAMGSTLCVLVAAANSFTSDLLIRQCYKTGSRDFEELAYATGGKTWLLVTEISILVLLLGNTIASIHQAAEAAVYAVHCVSSYPPAWLLYQDGTGYIFMALFTLVVIFPLCLFRQLRSMEYAGAFSSLILLFLVGIVVVQSIQAGMPALKDGSFPVAPPSLEGISQAVSVLGVGFYLQPLMLPLLNELPGPPRTKARILTWAMRLAVLVLAFGLYFLMGFFGAAWYGSAVQGNILQDELVGGGVPQAVLNFAVALHVSLTVPILVFCACRILTQWATGHPEPDYNHRVLVIGGTLFVSLQVAMFWHTSSARLLVLTGATGVMMVSYVCPIVNHFLLYFGRAKCQIEAEREYLEQCQSKVGNEVVADKVGSQEVAQSQAAATEVAQPPGSGKQVGSAADVARPAVLTYALECGPGSSTLCRVVRLTLELALPGLLLFVGVSLSVIAIYTEFFVDT